MRRITKEALFARVKSHGYDGAKDLNEIKKWLDERNYVLADADETPIDLDASWKTVYIKPTDNEKVVIGSEEDEKKAADDDEDEDKGTKAAQADQPRAKRPTAAEIAKRLGDDSNGWTPATHKAMAARKAYTHAAKHGLPFNGAQCAYADGDRAEVAGAALRLAMFGKSAVPEIVHGYAAQKKVDTEIVTKAGSIGDNASYGYLVVNEFVPELIENFNRFGAARLAAGVTPMARDSLSMPRWTDDVTVYDVGEGASIDQSDGQVDLVSLFAKKTAARSRMSNELLNDSAINIANQVTVSIRRAVNKFEDEAYLLGMHNRPGLRTTTFLNADSTYDASASDWGDWDVAKLQEAKAKLAGWALQDEELAFICNPSFYEAVLKVNAYSAGGTPGTALLSGIEIPAWDGVPVVFSNVMPRTFSSGQCVAFIGAFKAATKFGVVRGSEQIATSDQFHFDTDEVSLRYTQRWDYNLHDVIGTNTGVVALKD